MRRKILIAVALILSTISVAALMVPVETYEPWGVCGDPGVARHSIIFGGRSDFDDYVQQDKTEREEFEMWIQQLKSEGKDVPNIGCSSKPTQKLHLI